MNYATIQDLEVNPNTLLTPMIKQQLAKVINEEFSNQTTLYQVKIDKQKEELVEKYKKEINYSKLYKDYTKADDEFYKANEKRTSAEKALYLKGLTTKGNLVSTGYHHGYSDEEQREINEAIRKIENILNVANAQGPNQMKNKILSRLWLATTTGEALVILREVLGNGIIPSLTKSDVKMIGKE